MPQLGPVGLVDIILSALVVVMGFVVILFASYPYIDVLGRPLCMYQRTDEQVDWYKGIIACLQDQNATNYNHLAHIYDEAGKASYAYSALLQVPFTS
jgi:hypothetical protein